MDNSGEPGRGVDITQWLLTCCPERSSTGCTGLFFGLPLFCTPARLLIGLDRGESGRTGETGVKKKYRKKERIRELPRRYGQLHQPRWRGLPRTGAWLLVSRPGRLGHSA